MIGDEGADLGLVGVSCSFKGPVMLSNSFPRKVKDGASTGLVGDSPSLRFALPCDMDRVRPGTEKRPFNETILPDGDVGRLRSLDQDLVVGVGLSELRVRFSSCGVFEGIWACARTVEATSWARIVNMTSKSPLGPDDDNESVGMANPAFSAL